MAKTNKRLLIENNVFNFSLHNFTVISPVAVLVSEIYR